MLRHAFQPLLPTLTMQEAFMHRSIRFVVCVYRLLSKLYKHLWILTGKRISAFLSVALLTLCFPNSVKGVESPIQLRPEMGRIEGTVTLTGAVKLAEQSYPKILERQAEVRAAQKTVTVQKIKEYMPTSLFSYQDVVASHNRLTQTLFSTAALPTTPGPGPESVVMRPKAFSAAGFIIDWAPIDFGLHKARIDLSKAEYQLSTANYALTLLDVRIEAAARFLDTMVMREQLSVADTNVDRFAEFSRVVHAQVSAGLKPGADASLADSQLANAQNDLIRARLNLELAKAALAFAIGRGGNLVDIDSGGMLFIVEPSISTENKAAAFENHPLSQTRRAVISARKVEKRILNTEYYPKLRWLAGFSMRGTTFHTNRGDVPAPDLSGVIPVVPNWNVGLMVDLPVFDIVRIQAEKKVVDERITAASQSYNLALQQLKTEDVQAKSRIKAAIDLAANMPVQVRAALMAAQQAQARYEAGLATVAQVAEANQILADSRVKEAVANVGVWKALLSLSSVHGDLVPFLNAAERATRRERP